jgi:hypothetical protein
MKSTGEGTEDLVGSLTELICSNDVDDDDVVEVEKSFENEEDDEGDKSTIDTWPQLVPATMMELLAQNKEVIERKLQLILRKSSSVRTCLFL